MRILYAKAVNGSQSFKQLSYPLIIVLMLLGGVSCQKPFDNSPYETDVPAHYRNTTAIQLQKLAALDQSASTVRVALLSDNHYFYNDLANAVNKINARADIDFILILGDLADQGLLREYMLFHDVMDKSTKPYLTVIGNHDYLANAEVIYDKMFGPRNYTFEFRGHKFVMFDDTFWESEAIPDFDWLAQVLQSPVHAEAHTFICAHITPYSDQFPQIYNDRYRDLAKSANVNHSLHGHGHSYYYGIPYNDGVKYVVVPSIDKRSYCELAINGAEVTLTQVNF